MSPALLLLAVTLNGTACECEPVTRAGIQNLSRSLALDARTERWLLDHRRRLGDPGDLFQVPGLNSDLREAIEAGLCWERTSAATLAHRSPRWESRAALDTPRWTVRLRTRHEAGESPLLRGGVTVRWGRWRWTAGSAGLSTRLGQLIQTLEVRGGISSSGSKAVRLWRLTRSSADPVSGTGWHVEGARWSVQAGVWKDARGRSGPALRAEASLGGGRWGVNHVPGGVSVDGVWFTSGEWRAELARAGEGWSGAVDHLWNQGPLRLRSRWALTGTGFESAWRSSNVPGELLVLEGRVRLGRGRWLEGSWTVDQPVEKDVRRRTLEVGGGESLGEGWTLEWSWRGRDAAAPGPERLRLQVERRGLRVRWERRRDEVLSTVLAVRHAPSPSWLLRAVWVRGESAYVYRRRAGSLYGWDRIAPGTWLGFWARLPLPAGQLEISGDGTARGAELVLAWSTRLLP